VEGRDFTLALPLFALQPFGSRKPFMPEARFPRNVLTAAIKGGSSGVKDTTGNALEQDQSWTFATAPSQVNTTPS
jgi:hypothetical protein